MKQLRGLLLLAMYLLPLNGFTQDKTTFGIRFIPQQTTLRYDAGVSPLLDFLKSGAPYYQRLRTAQGLGMVYYPLKRVGLGADLLYSLQGGGYRQRKTNLDYIKLPLWIGFQALPKWKLIFTVQSGIELSYLVRALLAYEDGSSIDIGPYVRKASVGIPLAAGFKFKISPASYLTAQLYVYTDLNSLAITNPELGAYNYIYPGFRLALDQNFSHKKNRQK